MIVNFSKVYILFYFLLLDYTNVLTWQGLCYTITFFFIRVNTFTDNHNFSRLLLSSAAVLQKAIQQNSVGQDQTAPQGAV